MTPRRWSAVGPLLIVLGIAGHILRWTIPPSELARKGSRSIGQVLYKDSRPEQGGGFTLLVTFVFPDATHRNYQVTRVVPDRGVWEKLKAGGEVRVIYMPDRPEEASIEGAEGLARPHDAAYAYLAWTFIVAGIFVSVQAIRRAGYPDGREPAMSSQSAQGGARYDRR